MAATAWNAAPALTRDLAGDERLARLAARGDERAFGTLYRRHLAGITRYCTSILRNGADGEDAAQNTMLAALRSLQSGTVPVRVKPWLFRIAHNEAIAVVRRRRPAEELDERVLSSVADAEETGVVRERLAQLMTDLAALTERQRQSLVLRELYGFSHAELAATLGCSEAAAQQTVFEARTALAQFGEGRALACEGIQRAMSECDGMRVRTRRFRAHLRGCDGCRAFESALLVRRRDLGLLFPPTAAAGGLVAALARLVGLGGSSGEPLLAGLGLKGVALGLAVLAGGGAVVATSVAGRGGSGGSVPPAMQLPPAAPSAAVERTGAGATHAPAPVGVRRPSRRVRKHRATSTAPHSTSAHAPVTAAAPSANASPATSVVHSVPVAAAPVAPATLPVAPRAPSPVTGVVDTVAGVAQPATAAVPAVTEPVVDAATGVLTGAVHDVTGAVGQIAGGSLPALP